MDDKRPETTHPTKEREHFEKEGYNSNMRGMPIDIEPVPEPEDRMGAAIDVRKMPDNGVVEVHKDDDDVILDDDEGLPAKKDRP